MAKINGTLLIFDLNSEPLAHVESAALNIDRELPDANDKDSGPWADHLDETGILDWSIDVNGNADWTEGGNVEKWFDIQIARQAVNVVFGPEAADHLNFTGKASLNNVSLEGANEQTATFSGSAQGQGQLSKLITS